MVGADDSVLMALPAYQWTRQGSYEDVLLDLSADEGIARISINRPEKRNAFRPRTVSELYDAFARVRERTPASAWCFSPVLAPRLMVPMPSVLVAINQSEVMVATSMRTALRGSMFLTCSD